MSERGVIRQMEGQRKPQTFTYPNMIVRVHFPDLTDAERKRRNKELYKAAEDILKSVPERKKKKDALSFQDREIKRQEKD